MNKEDILAMSRQENKYQDLYEQEVNVKAGTVALVAVGILCCVYALLCNHLENRGYNGYTSILFVANAASNIYKAIKFKLKRKEYIVFAVMWSVMTVVTTAMHVQYLFGLD